MASDPPAPEVEIGRIVFRSWEHQWQTDEKTSPSVGSARRVLPNDFTKPIYEILERWERVLLRCSLPLMPYGLRVRRAAWERLAPMDGSDCLTESARQFQPLNELCPEWDRVLPQERTKQLKFGQVLCAPSGDDPLTSGYGVEWKRATLPETVNLDDLLRKFSPRYEEPPPFGFR